PGDVILSTPIFEALKEKISDCRITAVIRPESVSLVENNPHVNDLVVYDKYGVDHGISGMIRTARKLRGNHQAIIVQRHLRSALIAFLAGIPERIGYENSSAKLLYTRKVRYREEFHEVRRCLSLIDTEDGVYKPRIFIDEKTEKEALGKISDIGITGEYAVVAPGSVWPTKRYPYYPGLIHLIGERFGLPVIMLGGKDDILEAKSIEEGCRIRPRNLVGKTFLLESASIISKAKIVFANDSAPAHIAAAMDTPVVAIFGSTVKEFGFVPYSEISAVVDIGELYCRPCGIHGTEKCPEKHFRCMMELPPSKIIEVAGLLFG
ncbi:MAG: glycosyltransferase family 9 protein, partial [candidate division Zixibacteria bacterium]